MFDLAQESSTRLALGIAASLLVTAGVATATVRSGATVPLHAEQSPPPRAFAPIKFLPLPHAAMLACRAAQRASPHPILCPARLPRPTLGWPKLDDLPRLEAEPLPSLAAPEGRTRTRAGVSFGYGAPVEPSHSAWKKYVWLNRPCCLLHVVVMWVPLGKRFIPAGARPARLAGRSGLLRRARGYALGSASTWPQTFFWANHVWFAWRRGGIRYLATSHYFGPETTQFLARVIRELRPAPLLK
jgi:hypothetical protein